MVSVSGLHAVRAMAELGALSEGQYLGAAELAGLIQAPRNYLGKLLQSLARRGVLAGRKGKGGGFRLSRDAKDIRLLDVLDPAEEVTRMKGCLLGRRSCREEAPCAAHRMWSQAREAYLRFLTQTSVADLTNRSGQA
jgi:Rrf2 family protein